MDEGVPHATSFFVALPELILFYLRVGQRTAMSPRRPRVRRTNEPTRASSDACVYPSSHRQANGARLEIAIEYVDPAVQGPYRLAADREARARRVRGESTREEAVEGPRADELRAAPDLDPARGGVVADGGRVSPAARTASPPPSRRQTGSQVESKSRNPVATAPSRTAVLLDRRASPEPRASTPAGSPMTANVSSWNCVVRRSTIAPPRRTRPVAPASST
jgi:hypothetical protein